MEAMKPKEVTSDYLLSRVNTVQKHFEGSITADDFLMRLEMSLCGYGFTGENTIGEQMNRTKGISLDASAFRCLVWLAVCRA